MNLSLLGEQKYPLNTTTQEITIVTTFHITPMKAVLTTLLKL